MSSEHIGIIGLGYVGLPLALALGRRFPHVLGFDLNQERIHELQNSVDRNRETDARELKQARLGFSADSSDLAGTTFFIVTVPTPIDALKRPDLTALQQACQTVGKYIQKGGVVVFESTVYPGLTREVCGPIIEKSSGLRAGIDFKLAYSPERINPGDPERRLENIRKVVSAQDEQTLARVGAVYEAIIHAGIYKASSIEVAEAAKVIENTQRDLNIALMNELAIIFDRLNIPTREVLNAASTKWNFLRFSPGLVGGHCIGVDPYYLTCKAEQIGYLPQVILAGRRINDSMGVFIAQKLVKLLINDSCQIKGAKVAVFGLTFKENVADLRNSRVPDIFRELAQFGISAFCYDPLANPEEALSEYGLKLCAWEDIPNSLDAVILAVPHKELVEQSISNLLAKLKTGGFVIDVKSVLDPSGIRKQWNYWSL